MNPNSLAWRPSGNGSGGRHGSIRRLLGGFSSVGITDAIIAICVVMLLVTTVAPNVTYELLFFPAYTLDQPYRLITSAFLHSSFWHIAFNMITLYLVGMSLERSIGRLRYAALYLLSAIGGNVGVLAWAALLGQWQIAAVGASGAVFGLFGALLAFSGVGSANFRSVAVLVIVNLIYGVITPGVSWQSHVAGFIVGFLLAWLWKKSARQATGKRTALEVVSAFAVAALLAIVILAIFR